MANENAPAPAPAPASPRSGARASMGWFLGVTAITVVLDQVTKWWALASLTDAFRAPDGTPMAFGQRLASFMATRHPRPVRRVEVIEGLWQHAYYENPGAAWSLLRDAPEDIRVHFFLVATVAAIVGAVWYVRRSPDLWTRVAVGLIVGGALGNFVDRLRFGYVIDFIRWHWFDRASWPVFNVADVGVTVGVLGMFLVLGQAERAERRAAQAPTDQGKTDAGRAERALPQGAAE